MRTGSPSALDSGVGEFNNSPPKIVCLVRSVFNPSKLENSAGLAESLATPLVGATGAPCFVNTGNPKVLDNGAAEPPSNGMGIDAG